MKRIRNWPQKKILRTKILVSEKLSKNLKQEKKSWFIKNQEARIEIVDRALDCQKQYFNTWYHQRKPRKNWCDAIS